MPLGILYGPVIGYNDVLYMGERALSPDTVNYFYAVDKNGNDLWTFETSTFFANNGGPTITKDSTIYFTSANSRLYAINSNGNLSWVTEGDWVRAYRFRPIDKYGDLYFFYTDTLIIISPSGNIKNKIPIPYLNPPLVFSIGGDTIFFKTGGIFEQPGNLNAADLEGNIYWSHHFAFHNWGIPLVDNNNKIYVFGSDSVNQNDRFLYCFNLDGSVDWSYPVSVFLDYTAPTIDRNGNIILNARKIINGEERNCIISLDYYGNENWVTPFEGDWDDHYINHGLVCDADGKIYCGSSTGGNFYCFDNDGELLWTLDLGELEYDSCPAIGSDGTLYIGTHISSTFPNHEQNLIAIRDTVTSVDIENRIVESYRLEQNYPNPFNSITHIRYKIPKSGVVLLKVYDILGNEVSTLLDRFQDGGEYDVIYKTDNLSSGIYFYTLTSGNFRDTKKLILLK
jgi:outer membrane protein assembly factor BamB